MNAILHCLADYRIVRDDRLADQFAPVSKAPSSGAAAISPAGRAIVRNVAIQDLTPPCGFLVAQPAPDGLANVLVGGPQSARNAGRQSGIAVLGGSLELQALAGKPDRTDIERCGLGAVPMAASAPRSLAASASSTWRNTSSIDWMNNKAYLRNRAASEPTTLSSTDKSRPTGSAGSAEGAMERAGG